MTMLKSFDLKGNKQSFANWISNLSPTETPFISMIPKQKVDQTQYSWQVDRLSQPGHQAAAGKGEAFPKVAAADVTLTAAKEGEVAVINNLHTTTVYDNQTQIFRKAVRVTDTTKKISVYGRNSELTYQMEKAGLEIKRDLEHALLNSFKEARPGTAADYSICAGIQKLVAPIDAKDPDTGAVVHKVVQYTYTAASAPVTLVRFTKDQVWDLTYNLYLVGSRANKIMFHPMHMAEFSRWIGSTRPLSAAAHPHLHRMFDGMDDKYNAYVKKIRDPLGQEFTLIPNRHMPRNQLFFFNEADWTQMILREPEKIVLAKMGSSEKHMIEMEVGLRLRHPFASGILEFNETGKNFIQSVEVTPFSAAADGAFNAFANVHTRDSNGADSSHAAAALVLSKTDGDGNSVDGSGGDASSQTNDGSTAAGTGGISKFKIKATAGKPGRTKITAASGQNPTVDPDMIHSSFTADFHEVRD